MTSARPWNEPVLLVARHAVARGRGADALMPDRLIETFGIVIRDTLHDHGTEGGS